MSFWKYHEENRNTQSECLLHCTCTRIINMYYKNASSEKTTVLLVEDYRHVIRTQLKTNLWDEILFGIIAILLTLGLYTTKRNEFDLFIFLIPQYRVPGTLGRRVVAVFSASLKFWK